jgi:polysaccharide chain length determinant protein (PEP-CTERM system associated)
LNLNINSDTEREELIRQMVNNIGVRLRGIELFEISYQDPNPQLTKQVANEITQKYIEDNQSRYSILYTSSLDALRLEQGRLLRQLKQKETQMTKFQEENTEFLVSDVSIKSQIYSQQREVQRLANEVQAASKILRVLNNKLNDTPEMIESEKTVERDPKYEMVEKELTTLELSMDRLLLRFTEKHPEVKALREQVAMRKAQMEELEKKTKENVTEAVNPIYQRLMEQVTEQEIQIQNLQGQLENARELFAELKLKEEKVPVLEEENRNLTRDYEGLKMAYDTLSAKIRELETKEQMERRGQQIQFTIQDMARAPSRPISPNVPMIAGAGLVLGLGLGFAMAFGREYFDHSLRSVDQLRSVLSIPVLGAVPVLVTEEELRQNSRELRRKWLLFFLILFLLVAALAGVAIYWYWDALSIRLGLF